MGDVYRESRYRDYDDPPSDDDRYKRTTVRRYKVRPGRDDQYESVEVDDDYRSRYSSHARGHDDHHDYERQSERPRPAFEPPDDRARGGYYEREVERDYPARRDSDRDRITVVEGKESDYEDRRSRYGRHDDDVRVERRVEDRFEDAHGHDVDHYRKETEYYARASPPPSPVFIRERPREPQKIIVQEPPNPAPIVVPRQDPGAMVVSDKEAGREVARRDRGRGEDDYYYRHQRREVGPYRGDPDRERDRDREYAMARYDRHRRDQGYSSDEDDYTVRRRIVRRERSESPHHKRHLAAGALAGAGITALMNSRRGDQGDLPEHRGRKIVAGSALGALGTEAVRRAHSAYEERHGDGRESPDHHSHLKKGLGIAAVALAAAGAAKYYQSNKIEKEEAHRGRSRRRSRSRHGGSEYSASHSRSRTKSRRRSLSTAAKAALGTAATAGLVHHYRKKSQSRHGSRSRSKSRLRRAAEIGGAAAAAGVATKAWKNHKDKKEREERSRERSRGRDYSASDDESDYRRRRSLDRNRSQSRSQARSLRRGGNGTDPELGLVEYGNDPLSPSQSFSQRGYESKAEERRHRRRRRRNRSTSEDGSEHERPRSKSRLRDMAAAGAAAIGIKEFKDRKDQEKRERKFREGQSRDLGQERSRDRSRDRSRRRHDDDPDGYFDERPRRAGSPPVTSGGAYYPPYPSTPGAGPAPGGYTQFPNQSADYQPYIPQDYTGYPPPPAPGPPPAAGYPAPPPGPPAPGPPPHGPPPGGANIPPDHVSDKTRRHRREDAEDGVRESPQRSADNEPPPNPKSVSFIPLSPMSSRTMEAHRRSHIAHADSGDTVARDSLAGDRDRRGDNNHLRCMQRGSSDPSADRSVARHPASDSDEEVEILPNRFDSQGRPLDPLSARQGLHGRWTTRSGQFERRPRRPGDWDISGSWQVGGTDPEAVERMVRGVTGALDGRRGWMGVLGDVLNSGLLGGGPEERQGPQDDDGGRGRHRR